jgi:hypothetical protein
VPGVLDDPVGHSARNSDRATVPHRFSHCALESFWNLPL